MTARPLPLAAAALLALLSSGCAKDRMSLEPYGVCAMPDSCSFSGSCDAYHLGVIGYLPAGGNDWLQVAVELRNQKLNNAEPELGRVNNNDAHITGLILDIEGPTGTSIEMDVGHQSVPADGTAVVWTYLLPPASVEPLATGTYTVGVSYIGYYDNGDEFETAPFPIAVELDATPAIFALCGYADPPTNSIAIAAACPGNQQNLAVCP
jgi:hypothetical protein